jgi:methionine aminotransferase
VPSLYTNNHIEPFLNHNTVIPIRMRQKLPNVGTSIFTVMSQMANECGAINLSQGFPDFEVSRELIDSVHFHMMKDRNQYAPMAGVPALLERLAEKFHLSYKLELDPATDLLVTSGATEALFAAITAFVHPDDEVIIFEPAYDSYEPAVRLNGGIPVGIKLTLPDFSIDWNEVEDKLSDRTSLIILNTPHNPTGAVLTREDLQQLTRIADRSRAVILSDEVYEHIIFDGHRHLCIAAHPPLRDRTISVFSFGKTFHATGWKTGYAMGPAHLITEMKRVHQFITFSVNTPTQWALADFLASPANYMTIHSFYQAKRDLFLRLIQGSRFEVIPCKGTYFQLLSYRAISDRPDVDMAEWMTRERGLASIPISVFYSDRHDERLLRFCFAKNDETLKKGAEILCLI